MKRTLLFSLVFLILILSACVREPSRLLNYPEKTQPEEESLKVVIEEKLPAQEEYELTEGDSAAIAGKKVTVRSISRDEGVKVDVDGVQGFILNTKDFEVLNDVKVETLALDFSSPDLPLVKIKFEEFDIGENGYLIYADTSLTLNEKRIRLSEVGEDFVYVEVGPAGAEKLILNVEKTLDGLRFKLLKTFYQDTTRQPHAWLVITSGA